MEGFYRTRDAHFAAITRVDRHTHRAMGGEKIGVGPFDVTPPNRHMDE